MSHPSFEAEFEAYLRGGYQILGVSTSEESRVEASLRRIARAMKYEFVTWDMAEGFGNLPPSNKLTAQDKAKYLAPHAALEALTFTGEQSFIPKDCVVMMKDLDDFMADIRVRRWLRALANGNRLVNANTRRPLVITGPSLTIHPRLRANITVMEFELPDEQLLSDTLDFVLSSIRRTDANKADMSDELRDAVVQSMLGLTTGEAENTLAKCAALHRGLTSPEIVETIKDEKANIIKKNQVLTYIPESQQTSQEFIGGFDVFLPWLNRRKLAYSKEARRHNIDYPKGVVLVGPPGCVADDTFVCYRRGKRNSCRRINITELYNRFNKLGNHAGPAWSDELPTYLQSWDPESGKVFYNQVKGVYDKGKKRCVRIVTANSGAVTLTYDHPVLMANGRFAQAGGIEAGDKLLVQGNMKPRKREQPSLRIPQVTVEGLKYHPYAWKKPVVDSTSGKTYEYGRMYRARLVVEAHMNGLSLEDYVTALKADPERCEGFTFIEPNHDVHHLNDDPSDDTLTNLAVMLKADHTREHGLFELQFDCEYTKKDEVVFVEEAGERQTYDVSMELPCANVVVNDGIIVHNTGKSMVGEAAARLLGLPGYIMDVGAVFGHLVGESESRMRDALKQIEAQRGCVLLVDEVDKAFGGAHTSGGDSGVTRRVFGQFLSWLANKKDRTFVIVTLNRTDGLPPEFLRAGRFDSVFSTDLPHEAEREQIMKIHLRKRGVDPDALGLGEEEWADLIRKTEGFVGSELEEVIREARYAAFAEGGHGNPSFDQLTAAVAEVTPVSVLDREGVESIRQFCASRAKPVTSVPRKARRQTPRSRHVDVGNQDAQ